MNDYLDRKRGRKEYYLKYVHGWKLRPCSACSGSGYYDYGGKKCGGCDGSGKERYRSQTKQKEVTDGVDKNL